MNLRFENPAFFWLLILVFTWAFWSLTRRRLLRSGLRHLVLLGGALVLCVLGLARPQLGTKAKRQLNQKSHFVLMVDISNSMNAADISPTRMAFSLAFAERLLLRMEGSRVALYAFAANGYLILPFTTDLYAVRSVLSGLSPLATTHQGTQIGESLETLFKRLSSFERSVVGKGGDWVPPSIVLLSDGESHSPIQKSTLTRFRKAQIPIHTVGVGTDAGTVIPTVGRYTGNPQRDRSGRPVVTRLVRKNLTDMSTLTQGVYFSPHLEEVPRLVEHLMHNARGGQLASHFQVKQEYFPWLFAIALCLFVVEFSKGRWQYAIRILWLPLLLLLSSSRTLAADDTTIEDEKTLPLVLFNKGVGSERDPLKAIEYYQEASLLSKDETLRKKALFNLGNAYLKAQDPASALRNYQEARDIVTSDPDFDTTTNRAISDNMDLAVRVIEAQSNGQGPGEEKQKPSDSDPKGPQKNFEAEKFSEVQKQKIFDQIATEELQTMLRIQDINQGKAGVSTQEKPW